MRTFYFVGGPTPGNRKAFVGRLEAVGGLPCGWSLYPHTDGSGKALHIVQVDSKDAIAAHLAAFAGVYEATEPVEVIERS